MIVIKTNNINITKAVANKTATKHGQVLMTRPTDTGPGK